MARKTINDLSGIASAIARSAPAARDKPPRSNAPALGALQGSLSAIREIDPELIDDWGPLDRLDGFTAVNSEDEADGFDALKSSISESGQQVPILIRRSQTEGRFEAIYGRRRLRACRDLGIKVRANVQDLDDGTALLAKGLENAARRNLSFYEKARFAQAIREAGHENATVREALGLSAPQLSHLTRVTDNVPAELGDKIGAAPKAGRPKWTALATALSEGRLDLAEAYARLDELPNSVGSDARIDALLSDTTKRGARPGGLRRSRPLKGVQITSDKTTLAVNIERGGENAAFAEWLDGKLESILRDAYRRFTMSNRIDRK